MGARVLFVDHADFLGGAEQSLLELIKALDPTCFSITLACPPGVLLDTAHAHHIRLVPLDLRQVRGVKNLVSAPYKLVLGVSSLVRLIRSERIQIVHSNTMRASIYAALAARLSGAKFAWHVRDLHREGWYLRLMSRWADAIIANSRAVARTLPSFARPKVTVVYNGLNLKEFDPTQFDRKACRAELGLRREHFLIGNIGWLAPWKGQREFIGAAALVAAKCAQARFVIVGSTTDERYHTYAEELHTLARDLLGDRLSWAGARQPVQPVLASLDLLLHCAEREPFGRVLIEAMAMRVPVIAFADGGPDEIIADGETGRLIQPHDTTGMAEAAVRLFDEPSTREAMGKAARARVETLFDSGAIARQIEGIYEWLT